LFLAYNCKTELKSQEPKNDKIMFETLDFKKFKEDNKEFEIDEYSDEYHLPNGSIVYISDPEVFAIPSKLSFYLNYKEFFENGSIKVKGKYFGIFKLNFYSIKIGYWSYSDEKGKLIQEVNEDKKFGKYSYNEVLKFLDEQKDINLNTGEGRDKVEIEYYYSGKSTNKLWKIFVKIGEAYQIPGKGYTVEQKGKAYYLDGETGENIKGKQLLNYKDIIPDFEQQFPWLIKSTAIYTTYNGKSYTEEEWKAFEQEHHNEYLRKRGREDEIKPVETPKTGNNNSSPGKKGAYENPGLGTPYTSPSELGVDKDIYQVYKGKYYTKAEWKEFHKSLPWWERLI
jgi:hypothetical protein